MGEFRRRKSDGQVFRVRTIDTKNVIKNYFEDCIKEINTKSEDIRFSDLDVDGPDEDDHYSVTMTQEVRYDCVEWSMDIYRGKKGYVCKLTTSSDEDTMSGTYRAITLAEVLKKCITPEDYD